MTQTNNDVKPIESTDLFAPRYVWGYFARWWDCVDEMLDMGKDEDELPGINAESWWYCDLYETEDDCIAETQAEAEAIFRHRYQWIEVFHVTLRGRYKPPAKKKARRKSRRANVQAVAPATLDAASPNDVMAG